MPASYGFQHLATDFLTDFVSSLRFTGGTLSHTGMPALPTSSPYTILAWLKHPGGASGNVYAAGSIFSVTSGGQLALNGLLTAGMRAPIGNWFSAALTFDGGTITTLYQDGEIAGVTGLAPLAFTGGAASTVLAAGGHLGQLVVVPGVALSQNQVRQWTYANLLPPSVPVHLRFSEPVGTSILNSGALAGTGHSFGASTAFNPDVPKMPVLMPIAAGSMRLDGSTNGTLTPNAGGMVALNAIFGGSGITLALWVRTAPGNNLEGRYPVAVSNGTTLLRAQADPTGTQSFQWTNIRANAGSAITNALALPRRRAPGAWMRMVAVVDVIQGVIDTYLDRVLQTRNQNAAHIAASWYGGSTLLDLRFGAAAGNLASSQWLGRIADPCIYRRPLSRQEVFSDFVGSAPTPDVRWRFNQAPVGSLVQSEGSIAAALSVGSGVVWSPEGPRQ